MLSSVGFQAKILCLLVCLWISTQATDWMFGKHTCGPDGNFTPKEVEKMWNKTFRHPDREIPEDYDVRDFMFLCTATKRIEKENVNCPASWALAVATMLTDRLCVKNFNKTEHVTFSVNDIYQCCTKCMAQDRTCSEPDTYMTPRYALEFWAKEGVVTEEVGLETKGCKYFNMWLEYGTNFIKACDQTCLNSYQKSYKDDKMLDGKGIACMYSPWDIKQIQIEIMTYGPVATSLYFTSDFQSNYKEGIYDGTKDAHLKVEGKIVVKIIGWGTDWQVPYWLVANVAWGDTWGEKGFFKILRGKNVRNFENQVYAGYFHDPFPAKNFNKSTRPIASLANIVNSPFKFIVCIILFCFLLNCIQHILT